VLVAVNAVPVPADAPSDKPTDIWKIPGRGTVQLSEFEK
jgi:hypothetical protein